MSEQIPLCAMLVVDGTAPDIEKSCDVQACWGIAKMCVDGLIGVGGSCKELGSGAMATNFNYTNGAEVGAGLLL